MAESSDNPFPGMNPWLEGHWGNVQTRLVTYAGDALRQRLPRDLRARIEERVLRPEPVRQRYLEIVSRHGDRVITVIEFLSPANKHPNEGQRLYLQKRDECRDAGVSFVEIDLLRGGRRMLGLPDDALPQVKGIPYLACVRRAWKTDSVEVHRMPLRHALPTMGVPLRETDDDAPLNLQQLVNLAYLNGDYDAGDYVNEPEPPLDSEDAKWADQILRDKGLR